MIITFQAIPQVFSFFLPLCFSLLEFLVSWLKPLMASRTRSRSNEPALTLVSQNIIRESEKEICSFNNADITTLKDSGAFPVVVIIRPFDREVRSDAESNEWVCFLAYPFSLGLRYPFPPFISRFFELTGLSYAQTMPMV
ncbi:hypothetical protein Hanom_Chr15g01388981 [Helianthus anomalus]